jgi:uncharacterized membrane protein YbhN (UPF0104 family)
MNGKTVLRFVLGLAAIGCFIYVSRNFHGQLHRLAEANAWLVAIGCLVYLLTLWLQSETLRWGMKSVGQSLTQRETLGLTLVSSYANLIVPKSGMGATAVYLTKIRKGSLADFGAVLFIGSVLFILATCAVGLAVFITDAIATGNMSVGLLSVTLSGLIASLVALRIDWQFAARYRGIGASQIGKLINARRLIKNSNVIFQLGLANFALVFLRALRLQIAFYALGESPSFFFVLMMSVLGDLSFLIAITPAAIGFRESAIAFGALKMGMPIPVALSVAVLDRLVFSLTTIVTAQFVIWFGLLDSHPDTESENCEAAI